MIQDSNIPELKIMGFKADITDVMAVLNKINQISSGSNCTLQLMDARGLAGKEHVSHAILHALNAFKRKTNIAKDLGMEICVRTSAQRQISKAIDILGLKEGPMEICAIVIGCSTELEDELNSFFENEKFRRDDDVLEPDEMVLTEIYGLENAEIELMDHLPYILMERTTLLILDA